MEKGFQFILGRNLLRQTDKYIQEHIRIYKECGEST